MSSPYLLIAFFKVNRDKCPDSGSGAERGTTPHRQRRRFRFGTAAVRNLRSASRAASMALIWPSSP